MTFSSLLETITRYIKPMPEESVPLIDALGRVAARPLAARRDLPPFEVSSLDGYAVKGPGRQFTVKGSLEPLGPIRSRLRQGEALFVPTGGRFPPDARFVACEYAVEDAQCVTVEHEKDDRKIVKKGDWLRKGRMIAQPGDVIGPTAMSLLAQDRRDTARVYGRPQVSVVATGDELKKGYIADSNKFLLAGLVRRDGGETAGLYTAGDDEEEIASAVEDAPGARLIILTGGTAFGKKDVTMEAVRRIGFRFPLKSAPILPGKTMAFGRKGNKFLFILPGRPTAVRTLYDVFVRPALFALAGRAQLQAECLLPLPRRIEKPAGAVLVIPVSITGRPEGLGEMYAEEPDGYIVLDEGVKTAPAGQPVRVLRV